MRDGWHLRLICEELEKVTAGKTKNLLLNLPPRHGKSLTVSVFWPVWEWITRPQEQYLCVSYDISLTQDLARKARDLINSEWFQSRWGKRFALTDDQDAKGHYTNDKQGSRISITVRGGATGKGGSRIIIDDPHSVRTVETDAERETVIYWWGNVIKSRKNNPEAAFVVVMQRCHEMDLTGHILNTEKTEWKHVCLPARFETKSEYATIGDHRGEEGEALWPEMYPVAALDALQKTMDPYAVAGQYQQRPTGRRGGLFDIANLSIVEARPAGAITIRAWDFAGTDKSTADFTVGARVSETEDGKIYIEHIERGQWEPGQVEQIVKLTAQADGQEIPLCIPKDPAQAGKSQALNYVTRVLKGFSVYSRAPTKDKITRAMALASQVRVGNVYLVRGEWNQDLLNEFKIFPRGRNDDIVDACADAYNELIDGHGGAGSGINEADFARMQGRHYGDEATGQRPSTGGNLRWKKR